MGQKVDAAQTHKFWIPLVICPISSGRSGRDGGGGKFSTQGRNATPNCKQAREGFSSVGLWGNYLIKVWGKTNYIERSKYLQKIDNCILGLMFKSRKSNDSHMEQRLEETLFNFQIWVAPQVLWCALSNEHVLSWHKITEQSTNFIWRILWKHWQISPDKKLTGEFKSHPGRWR